MKKRLAAIEAKMALAVAAMAEPEQQEVYLTVEESGAVMQILSDAGARVEDVQEDMRSVYAAFLQEGRFTNG